MNDERLKNITEALFTNSASVLKDGILKYASIEELKELTIHSHERIAFRAAWALEHVLLLKNNDFDNHLIAITNTYVKSDNWSVLRSITKIIIHCISTQQNHKLSDDLEEILINRTFDIIERNDCPIAVRCNCYDILLQLCPKNNWIINELRQRISFDIEKNQDSPAIKSRAFKILKKLKRIAEA